MKKSGLVVLFGATGKSGFHTANALIDNGYVVRIVVRSKAKVTKLFKEKQISFQKIIQGSLDDPRVLKQAFEPSNSYGKVKYAISALGSSGSSNSTVEEIQYLSQVRIIEQAKQAKIQKYIFITSIFMTRPWNFICVLLNTIVPSVFHWKSRAQNYLRKSGLNYAIVRPSGLVGEENDLTVTNYKIDQGDKLSGRITRCTLGNLVKDVLDSKNLPPKVTFQCTGISKQQQGTGLKFQQLQPDTDKSIVTANHKTPKYFYGLSFLAASAVGCYLIVKQYQ